MKKRTVAAIIAAVLAMSALVGCGGSTAASSTDAAAETELVSQSIRSSRIRLLISSTFPQFTSSPYL